MLITSDKKAGDSLKYHIWNQHILLVNILEFEENQKTLLMSRPSAVRPIRTIKIFFKKKLADFRPKIETSFLVH